MRNYKIWLKKGTEKVWIAYQSELPPALLHYHIRTKTPRINVGNGTYNVLAWDTFWIEEVK